MAVSLSTLIILIILTILSVVLYLTEIYFIPGLGLSGILAAALTLTVLYFSFIISPYLTAMLFGGGVLIFAIGFYWLSKSKFIDRKSLKETIYGHSPNSVTEIQEGMEGYTTSRLSLSGNIKIGNRIYEATSEGGFLDDGVHVIVVRKDGNKIYVKPI